MQTAPLTVGQLRAALDQLPDTAHVHIARENPIAPWLATLRDADTCTPIGNAALLILDTTGYTAEDDPCENTPVEFEGSHK